MIRVVSCLNLAVLLLTTAPAVAQTCSDSKEVTRTSVSCRGLSLRGTLRALLRNAGLSYEVGGDVPDIPITLSLRNVPLGDAVEVLVRHARFSVPGVEVSERNGMYAISSKITAPPAIADGRPPSLPKTEPGAALLEQRAIQVNGLHLAEALEQYFDAADASFAIDPDVPDAIIPALLESPVTLWSGIQRVLAAARTASGELYVTRIGEIYVITRAPGPNVARATGNQGDEREHQVQLLLRDMPLRVAINALFRGSGYQYSFNPDVPNVPVTVEIPKVGLSRALRILIGAARKQVPGLTYSKG